MVTIEQAETILMTRRNARRSATRATRAAARAARLAAPIAAPIAAETGAPARFRQTAFAWGFQGETFQTFFSFTR